MNVQDMSFEQFKQVLTGALPVEFRSSVESADESQLIADCGLDSLATEEMQLELEEQLGVWVSCTQFALINTFGELFKAAKTSVEA